LSSLTNEQLVWNDKGYLSIHASSTYKIPATSDVPEHLKIDLWPAPNREDSVFGSKALGEPPLMLAISIFEALKDAIAATRPQQAIGLIAPATPENVLRALSGFLNIQCGVAHPPRLMAPIQALHRLPEAGA
jgi:xanthine dehydrogenase large subunit